MGQLTSKNEENWLKELNNDHTLLKTINDARYGEGKLYGNKVSPNQQVVHKDISVSDGQHYTLWKQKLQERQNLKHPNLIELKSHFESEEQQVCSTFYKVHLVFEYSAMSLKDAMEQRKMSGTFYKKEEVEGMLKGAVNGLAKLQEFKIPHQNLRPQTLSYNNEVLQVADTPLLTNITAFTAVLQDYSGKLQGYYLSPLLTKAVLDNNYQPQHNLYKSDVFTLGMIFMQVCLLQGIDHCYRYDQGIVVEQEIRQLLEQAQQVYNSDLIRIIEWMLDMDENKRPDFLELRVELNRQNKLYQNIHVHQEYEEDNYEPINNQYAEVQHPYQEEQEYYEEPQMMDHQQQPHKIEQHQHLENIEPALLLHTDQPDVLVTTNKISDKPSNTNAVDILLSNESIVRQQNDVVTSPKQSVRSYDDSIRQDIVVERKSIQPMSFAQSIPKQYEQPQYYQQPQTIKQIYQSDYSKVVVRDSQQVKQHEVYSSLYNNKPIVNDVPPTYQSIYTDKQRIPEQQQALPKYTYESQFDNRNNNIQTYQSVYTNKYTPTDYQQENKTQTYQSAYVTHQNVVPLNSQTTNKVNQYDDYDFSKYSQFIPKVDNYQIDNYQEKYVTQLPRDSKVQQYSYQSYQYQPNDINKVNQLLGTANFSPAQYVTETLENGEKYVGDKVNGIREGRGRVYYRDGGYYDGEWRNNRMHGKGVLYYASGRPAYDGDWVDDKFQGNGILYNDNPQYNQCDYRNLDNIGDAWTKYVGKFADDCKHGDGTLHLMNGDRYEGQFVMESAEGYGRYITLTGQVIQGKWSNNHYIG